MKKLLFIIITLIFISCSNTNQNSNSDSQNTNNQKNDSEIKTEIDNIIKEIDNSKDNLKTINGIATVKDDFGDFNAFYYDEENICLLTYSGSGPTEYYYFTKNASLCFAKTGEYHYQPWSYEENKFYISEGKITDSYKCIRENDVNEPCNDIKLEDKKLIADFEKKIPDRIKNLTKSIKDWPKLENALIELNKNK